MRTKRTTAATLRARSAQTALMVCALALVGLTWTTSAVGSLRGYEVDVGVMCLFVAAVTLVLIQLRLKAAWMGAGFLLAAIGREFLHARSNTELDEGAGLSLATAAALFTLVVLIADLFLNIHERPEGP